MTCSPLEYFAFPASLLFLVVVGEDCVKMCHDNVSSFEPEPELFLEWVLDLDLVSVGVLLGLDGYITWPNIITIFQISNSKYPSTRPSTTFPRIVDIELILYIVCQCHCQIRNYLTQLLSFDICYLIMIMSSGSYSEEKLYRIYDLCKKIKMQ